MWNGPWGGDFNSFLNWGNNRVPDSPGEYFVIDSGYAVMSANATVDKFGLINDSFLAISNSLALGVLSRPASGQDTHTGIFGGGTINMNAVQYGTYLYITGGQPGDFAIHGDSGLGNSFIRMSDSPNNIIYTNTPGLILINEGVIEGAGHVGYNTLAIQNSRLAGGPRAMIIATRPNSPLVIDPPATPLRNIDSILKADGGLLILRGGTFINEQGGFIEIGGGFPNSSIHLDAARIQGGLLAAPPGWSFQAYNGSSIANLTFNAHLRVLNSHVLYLEGTVVSGSASSLALEAVQYGTYLNVIAPNTAVTGVGEILLSNSPNNIIYTSFPGSTLTLDLLGGLRGSGQLGYNALFVTNNTAITAQGSAGLIIDPPASGFDNNGTLRAAANSTLTLLNGTIDNAGGEIVADPDGSGSLNGARVVGGLIRSFGTGTITTVNNSTIAGVTLTSGSNLRVANGHYLHSEGVHTLDGTLSLDAVQYGTFLNAADHTTLNGSGQVVLSNSPNNALYTNVAGNTLTNNLAGGVHGSGQIGYNSLYITNNTSITAQGSAGLIIDPPASGFDNNGTLRAASGATLTLLNGSFDNAGGQVLVEDSGIGYLNGARISNGSLRSLGTGFIGAYNNSTVANVTLTSASNLRVLNGHYLHSEGVHVIDGTLSLDAAQFGTFLNAAANTTLNGSGQVVLSNSPNNTLYTNVAGNTLTNNLAGGIRGSGQIGYNSLFVTNNTAITAQGSAGLIIDPPASGFDNNGTLRAASGSTLTLLNGTFDNTSGQVLIDDGGIATLNGARVSSGSLRTLSTGVITAINSSTIAGLTLTSDSNLRVANGHYLFAEGTLTIQGTLSLDAAQFGTFLNISTPTVTLAGGGEVVLSNSPNNAIYTNVAGNRLLNQNTIIRGAGNLGYNSVAITNRGVIRADAANTLTIDPPAGPDAFLNDTGGLVHASTGSIVLQAGVFRNLGTLRVDPARVFLDNADPFTQEAGLVRVDGELEVTANSYLLQGGTLSGTGRVDSNVTQTGGSIAPGNSAGILTIEGNLTQQPASFLDIEIGGSTPGIEHDRLVVTGTAAIGGTLRLSFLGGIPQNSPLTILTAASRTGAFALVDTPSGVTAVVDYTPTSVIVTLTCAGRADFNGDGFIDFFDYDDFVLCYEGILCPPGTDADINDDGFVDFFDYDDYVLAFEAGC
jgi:hypothetical protein